MRKPEQWNVRPGLKYEWVTKKQCGEWARFDPGRFCAVLRKLGGPLMLAGDSIARKMQDSIHNLLQVNQRVVKDMMQVPKECQQMEANRTVDRTFGLCKVVNLCGPGVPILRMRNDYLSLVEKPPFAHYYMAGGKQKPKDFQLPWLPFIKTWGIKALILNRGPHFAPTPQFAKELEQALVTVRKIHPDLLIVFRSSVPGHADCQKFEVPLRTPQNRSTLPYHWGLMHEQNVIARRLVESVGGVYLDVEPMNELRADGHMGAVSWAPKGDCLHHCAPGESNE